METLTIYLLKSSVWLTGFAAIYFLFLRNERFFVLNRIFLIAGIVFSIAFPFFTWHYTVVFPVTPVVSVDEPQIQGVVADTNTFDPKSLLLYAYLLGASYLIFRLVKQTSLVLNIIRKSKTLYFNSVKLVQTDRYQSSFSFFSFVFVNPSTNETEINEIVTHEQEHIRQRHWIDLLLFEMLCIVQWFNPVVWQYGRFIRQNHEFLADEYALRRSPNPALYRAALLNQMFGGPVISLSNSFNYSINKKRFQMMKQVTYSPLRKLKLLLVLPLMAGVFYAFATPEYKFVQAETELQPATIAASNPIVEQSAVVAEKTIRGRVVTEDGKPLMGTSIVISGTTVGTMPDANGYFELKTTSDAPLFFSFVGFASQKVAPEIGKEMVVVMKKQSIGIDAVSVSPISAQAGPILILSDGKEISKAEMDQIDPNTIQSLSIFKDQAAVDTYGEKARNGVIVISRKSKFETGSEFKNSASDVKVVGYGTSPSPQGANPGVVIRGINSIGGEQPLFVVDGVVTSSIEQINPNTIKSMNVLKGEKALEKYGEKAKDGAIELTLKKAEELGNSASTNSDKAITVVGYATNQQAQGANPGVVIRGLNSNSGAQPLFVINGVVSEKKDISDINPNSIESISVLKNESATKLYGEKAKDGAIVIALKKNVGTSTSTTEVKATGYAAEQKGEQEVFMVVEEMPVYPGGNAALMTYIANAVKYPVAAKENGIQGRVYVNFVVEKDGSVSSARVARGVDPSLDQEALRVVMSMPKWQPGKQRGVEVRVSYTVPINFTLQTATPETATKPENNSEPKAVFMVVEEMPQFPGGNAALMAYIATSTKYPEIAIKNGIQGKVFVNFVVSKTGKVTDAKIARGVDPSLDKEALRVVNSLPLWKPGVQRGVAVDVSYTVPVNFVLPANAPKKAEMLETNNVKKLTIVPNPAKDQVTITAEGMSEASKLDVNVFDRYGKQVKAEQKTGPTFTLSTSDLITGTYYIQARNGNDQYVGSLQVLH